MDKHSNETGDLEWEGPGTEDRVKPTLVPGVGAPNVDPNSDAPYERLMLAFKRHRDRRRRWRRLIAHSLSAASAVLGFFAMRRLLSR
jgi:hypothetical protein